MERKELFDEFEEDTPVFHDADEERREDNNSEGSQDGQQCDGDAERKEDQEIEESPEVKAEKAATKIQSTYRHHVAKRAVAQQLHRRHTDNQDAVRQEAARTITHFFRRAQLKKELVGRRNEAELEQSQLDWDFAAVIIQQFFHQYVVNHHLNTIAMNQDVLSAQTMVSELRQRQRETEEEEETSELAEFRDAASLSIQAGWRGYLGRKEVAELTKMLALERPRRGITEAERLARTELTLEEEDLWMNRANEFHLGLKSAAAHTVQRVYSNYITRKHQGAAAVVMQAWWRGMAGRRMAQEYKRTWLAARVIQCAWRCHTAVALVDRLYGARAHNIEDEQRCTLQNGASTIQLYWRKRRKVRAARTIQCAWKCHKAKSQVDTLQTKRQHELQEQQQMLNNMYATKIQRQYRAYCARRYVLMLKDLKRHAAALKVQAAVRAAHAYRKTKTATAEYRAYKAHIVAVEAALLIQTVWRGYRVRRQLKLAEVAVANYFGSAATNIQRVYRGHYARTILVEKQQNVKEHQRLEQAVIKIQCLWKSALARKKCKEKRHQTLTDDILIKFYDAATAIQAQTKGWLARKWYHKTLIQQAATAKIQQWGRYWVPCKQAQHVLQAKRDVIEQREKAEARQKMALRIQTNVRKHQAEKESQLRKDLREDTTLDNEDSQLRRYACQTVQRFWRGASTRHKLALDYKQYEAAKKIQSLWPLFCAKVRRRRLELEAQFNNMGSVRNDAAVEIQRKARKWLKKIRAQHQEAKMVYENEVAITLQLAWISHKARSDYLDKKKSLVQRRSKSEREYETSSAIVRLQSLFRGVGIRQGEYKIRKERRQMENTASTKIQLAWKAKAARERLAQRKLAKEQRNAQIEFVSKLTQIQKCGRGYMDRHLHAIRNVQASLEKTRMRRKLWSITMLQRIGRGFSSRKEFIVDFCTAQQNITIIQQFARCKLSNTKCHNIKWYSTANNATNVITRNMRQYAQRQQDIRYRQQQQELEVQLHSLQMSGLIKKETIARKVILTDNENEWVTLIDTIVNGIHTAQTAETQNKRAAIAVVQSVARWNLSCKLLSTIQHTQQQPWFVRGARHATKAGPGGKLDATHLQAWYDWIAAKGIATTDIEKLVTKEATQRKRAQVNEDQLFHQLLALQHTHKEKLAVMLEKRERHHSIQQKKLEHTIAQASQRKYVTGLRKEIAESATWFGSTAHILQQEHLHPLVNHQLKNHLEKTSSNWASNRKKNRYFKSLYDQPDIPMPAAIAALQPINQPPHLHSLSVQAANGEELELSTAIQQNNKYIGIVDLSNMKLRDEHVLPILKLIKQHNNTVITDIILSDNELSDTTAISVADLLYSNKTLMNICLDGNAAITDLGAKHLLNALKVNSTVQQLHLDNTAISQAFSAQIVYLLSMMPLSAQHHKPAAALRTTAHWGGGGSYPSYPKEAGMMQQQAIMTE